MHEKARKWVLTTLSMTAFVLVFAAPSRSLADDLETPSQSEEDSVLFEDIPSVFGASKYEQKVTEAPSSVSIVTAAEIEKYGYRTLGDILDSLPGFYASYDRNYEYIGVRGFNRPGDYNTRVLLLIDGHRINDNIYDQAPIGNDFPMDIDLIDRVEVIRGPSSSIYGSSAFFGVVNIITKRGRDLKGFEISGDVGSYETYKGRFSYGNRFTNGIELLLSGTLLDSEGQDFYFKEFDAPESNNGNAQGIDDENDYSFFLNGAYLDFTLLGVLNSREKSIPTAPWDVVFNDHNTFSADTRAYLDLSYNHNFLNQLDLMVRAYYDYYEYKGDYPYDYYGSGEPADYVTFKDYAKGEWWGGEIKLTKVFLEDHKLTLGGEYQDNLNQDQKGYDESPYFEYLNDDRNSRNWALYVQDDYSILPELIFNIGVRYDHYESFGGTTNPRLALIYNPLEKTTLKLIYGKAFRAPNAYELFYHDGYYSSKDNPDLEPEKITTYEAIWEQYFGSNIRTSALVFYYKIDDLISQNVDPSDDLIVFRNVDQVDSKGIELAIEGKWLSGVEGRISYTYQDAENRETGDTLTNSPLHLAKLNLIVPVLKDKIFAGTEVLYNSARNTLAGQVADDFWTTNITLFGRNMLTEGLRFSASVYNLFDNDYGVPGAEEHLQDIIQQDGRSYRFKLTYAF